MRLVASGLSTAGYVTVATVMGLENVLDRTEGFVARFDRERGRDPGLYYLRVFGEPGGAAPWGWRFGGHHVSLNNLVVDGALVATTPCFLGADPAVVAAARRCGEPPARPRRGPRPRPGPLAAPGARGARGAAAAAPSDIVTANRTRIAEGDRVIPLAGIWRDGASPTTPSRRSCRRSATRSTTPAATATTTTPRSSTPPRPRACRPPSSTPGSASCCARCWRTYLDRVPAEVSPIGRYADDATLDAVHFAWAGPDRARRAALLPAAGPAAAGRVGQHPARRQPRPLGVARPDGRLRPRRPRRPPRRPPLTGHHRSADPSAGRATRTPSR